ncbi:hypothetical protein ZIOFF_048046 [Zingiber officinale]|uniref:HMA domain-containing protein n=1 Tax=Zingiber officinale TaxID=94328 RepID=A0A8J5FVY0_ZINOF|nr:hypothetical protein ZIOFF_048046 [Zingiber officinale]
MAKEVDLKSLAFVQRVDLKVFVNCCDGCKRKVLKALSIKGVLRVEIHPTQPKVTVISNVDIGVLIKKLSKVGKCVEVLDEKAQKPQGEDGISKNEKEKEKEGADKSSTDTNKKSKSKNHKNKEDNDKYKKGKGGPSINEAMKGTNPTIATAIPHMNLCPIMVPQAKVYYPMEPIVVPVPYYAMTVHPTPVTYYVQDYSYYETPVYRPPPPQQQLSQAMTAFGDYFDEDNTVGCRIM